MPRSNSRSSGVYGSSDRFVPSAIKPTNGRGSLPPAKIGTSSAAFISASHFRSAGGTRATGDCSSSRNTSSGLSDHRSSVITPLSARRGVASTRSVDTGAKAPEGLLPVGESDANTAMFSGWSAESIWVTTIATRSRGSAS